LDARAPETPHDSPPLACERLSPETEPLPPPALGGWGAVFRAMRHRNFRLFVSGQIVSLVGTWMQMVAQNWLVYRLTHSEWLLGATGFCQHLPVFLLAPLGGLAADRCSRHRLVMLTQTLSMVQALGLALLTLTGQVQVWHVLAVALVLGTINAFDMPGRQSLVIQLTGKEDLLNAIALNSAIFNAARVVGPAVAGVLVASLGEGICFLLNSVSFLAVLGGLLAMRLPAFEPRPQKAALAYLIDGFRYAQRTRLLRVLLGLVAAVTVSSMPALVLMPFFADAIFHRGSQGLGFLMGAMGTGAVVGTLVLAKRPRATGLAEVIFVSALGVGLGYVLFALSPSFYLSLAIVPIIGFSVMRHNTAVNTVIQVFIPDEYRGRIMALYAMMVVGVGPFGSLAAGALAARFGARLTVMLGGLLCLSAAAAFRLYCPRGACEAL